MPELIIMTGLPGSGKSTRAKEILFETPSSVIISTDDYWTIGQHYCFDQTRIGEAHKWNQWRCEQVMKKELNAIVDNTNLTLKDFKPYIDLGIKYKYNIRIEESLSRWKDNVKACYVLNTHNVPWEVMQAMKNRQRTLEQLNDDLEAYLMEKNK